MCGNVVKMRNVVINPYGSGHDDTGILYKQRTTNNSNQHQMASWPSGHGAKYYCRQCFLKKQDEVTGFD